MKISIKLDLYIVIEVADNVDRNALVTLANEGLIPSVEAEIVEPKFSKKCITDWNKDLKKLGTKATSLEIIDKRMLLQGH